MHKSVLHNKNIIYNVFKMPFQHLHDDIERRVSSRTLGAVLSF